MDDNIVSDKDVVASYTIGIGKMAYGAPMRLSWMNFAKSRIDEKYRTGNVFDGNVQNHINELLVEFDAFMSITEETTSLGFTTMRYTVEFKNHEGHLAFMMQY